MTLKATRGAWRISVILGGRDCVGSCSITTKGREESKMPKEEGRRG